ncbi:hypothetical protein ACO0RG_003807 [Hanseniaspora osmophila]|uniref:Uncharacterized protein n=1 Tax=Hanseniaspora osmophila TaxID=56408 RepID=A0A1E5REI9_9ASCO|nr:hypothetical protein AWRI3579_g2446 [Hanseniaspora osmophila]
MTLIYFDVASIPTLIDNNDIFAFAIQKDAVEREYEKLNPVGSVMRKGEIAHFDPNANKIRVFLQFVRVVDEYDDLYENSEYDGIILEFKNYDGFRTQTLEPNRNENAIRKRAYFFMNRYLYKKYFISPKFSKIVQPGQLLDVWCIPQYVKRQSDLGDSLLYSISLISIIENPDDLKCLMELCKH